MDDGTETLRDRFLAGMAHAAATVNIVTTDGPAGRAGVTVSAMSSVSADTPRPTLLTCVHHLSPAAEAIRANGVFCVNVLRDDQTYISDSFAGRFKDRHKTMDDKFTSATWRAMDTGSPRVVDPLAAFDCRVTSAERVGTHYVFMGEVADIFAADSGSPLIYAQRSYGRPSRIETSTDGRPHADTLRLGCFHTFGPHILPDLLNRLAGPDAPELHLVEGDHRRMIAGLQTGEIDLALMFDFDLGPDIDKTVLREMPPYALLAAGHPLAASDTVSLADLAPLPMILLESPPSADYFTGLFTAAGLTPAIAYRSASLEMVRGLVARDLGFSVLATKPAPMQSYDGSPLRALPLRDTTAPCRLVMAHMAGRPLPPAAERFAQTCRDLFDQPTESP